MSTYHIPVLLTESIDGLHIVPGGIYIDGTLGGGGHTREIIQRGGFVLGIDADLDAIEENRKIFERNGIRGNEEKIAELKIIRYQTCSLVHANFCNIQYIAQTLGFTHVDGVLFDLGVSSHQLDTPSRGFSYRYPDYRIDLRLNNKMGITGEYVLNSYLEYELYEIFSRFAEEKHSLELSHAFCRARKLNRLITTGDVLSVIRTVVIHEKDVLSTASRVFQALRIFVNEELDVLKKGLHGAYEILDTNGRCSVISFHSLEDRIVKQEFRCKHWKKIGKPAYPSQNEMIVNKRSKSATLRIAQKI